MKKIIYIVLAILVLVLVYWVFSRQIVSNERQGDLPLVKNNTVEKKETITTFLVPVSEFKNTRTDYTFGEFVNSNLISIKGNESFVPEGLQVEMVEAEEIGELLKNGKVALLTPDQVQPTYKTLSVDGNYFWADSFDSKSYPFKKDIKVSEVQDYGFDRTKLSNVFAVGEIIPARAVDRLGLNKYNDYTYLFDYFRKDIESADLSIGLLENSLLGDPTPCQGCMRFQGDDKVAKGLSTVGFDLLSTAGNHAGDAGQNAYLNTAKLLTENEIQFTGTGNHEAFDFKSADSVHQPVSIMKPIIKTVNGNKIGMLSADDVASYYWKNDNDTDTYGTNHFSVTLENGYLGVDEERLSRIQEIKTQYDIDYLIVYMSWGIEYMNGATSHQKELGHALIDAGADIVIGSHPHWVQNIEFYNGKAIIYSLGNFIFDQTHTLPTRQGAVVNLYYSDLELKSIEIMPQQICGYHQTSKDLAQSLINKEKTLEEIYVIPESKGCVYWQPKKLKEDNPSYKQILERMFEFTEI